MILLGHTVGFIGNSSSSFEMCKANQLVAKTGVQAAVNANIGWNGPLVAPLQQMKPGEFADARIKSLNSYNPKSLEKKPE
ncbi:hypothetical protein TURU_105623 [Turdus rufiventris]|nr:hypothetical protein TURU_105623 [Turdus rufiventris]